MTIHRQLAEEFMTAVRGLGFEPDFTVAGTGTIYVSVDGFKVRFADHGECYCHEDISVDPDGCEGWQALAAFCRHADLAEPAFIAAERQRRDAARADRMAAMRAERDTYAIETARLTQRQALLNEAGLGHLTGKARKRAIAKMGL